MLVRVPVPPSAVPGTAPCSRAPSPVRRHAAVRRPWSRRRPDLGDGADPSVVALGDGEPVTAARRPAVVTGVGVGEHARQVRHAAHQLTAVRPVAAPVHRGAARMAGMPLQTEVAATVPAAPAVLEGRLQGEEVEAGDRRPDPDLEGGAHRGVLPPGQHPVGVERRGAVARRRRPGGALGARAGHARHHGPQPVEHHRQPAVRRRRARPPVRRSPAPSTGPGSSSG